MKTPFQPHSIHERAALVLATAAVVFGLSACDQNQTGQTPGQQLDSVISKTEGTATAAANKAAELADKARDNTKAYLDSPQVKQDVASVKDAISNAGSALKDTTGDAAITATVSTELARDPDLSARRIDVETKAGVVRLSGPAPTAEAKAKAERLALNVKGVASVDNQLVVGAVN